MNQDADQDSYRVIHWNAFSRGGAWTAVSATHRVLRENGVPSRIQVHRGENPHREDVDYLHLGLGQQPRAVLRRLQLGLAHPRYWVNSRQPPANSALPRREFHRAFLGGPTSPPQEVLEKPGTILHLHWVVGMVDYPSFFPEIPPQTPVVWTCHDSAPFTGGCYHPAGCTYFLETCGNCHFLPNPGPEDASALNHRIKSQALAHLENLHVVGVSEFMAARARESSLFRSARSIRAIHNIIDFDVFQPLPREVCREMLQLPIDAPVILMGAHQSHDWRKGHDLLLEALQHLQVPTGSGGSRPVLLTFGLPGEDHAELAGFDKRRVGFIEEPAFLAMLYNAADVFVSPSREEAFGLVALEAGACGTPVVAFQIGGLQEVVEEGETGFLAEPEDPASLRDCLQRLLSDRTKAGNMGRHAAGRVRERFSAKAHFQAHDQLYREALAHADSLA